MVQKSGDKQNIATVEIEKHRIPDEKLGHYPVDTLIIDPSKETFSKDKRIELDLEFNVSADQYVCLRFLAGADYINDTKLGPIIGTQIVVFRKNPFNEYRQPTDPDFSAQRFEAFLTDKFRAYDYQDLTAVLESNRERIRGGLFEEAAMAVWNEITTVVQAMKRGMLPRPQWVIERRRIISSGRAIAQGVGLLKKGKRK